MTKHLLLCLFSMFAAINIQAQYENVNFESGGLGSLWTWTMDQNGTNPPLEFIANPVSGGSNTTATVAKFTALQSGQPWALTYTDDMDDFIFDATNTTVKIMVYKSVISDVAIKFEGASAPIELKQPNTVVDQWEELTYDFSAVTGNTYGRLVIIPDFQLDPVRTSDNIIYLDEIQIPEGNTTPPNEPTVGAPIPIHDEATDFVLSVFSDTYTDLPNTDFNPNWGQTTAQSIVDIAGNSTNKYENLTYQGTQLESAQDVSNKGYLHVDFWTSNSTNLQFFLISLTTGEKLFNLPIATEQWVSIDIPMHEYVSQGLGITDIHQFKVVGDGTVFFDNWYWHGEYFEPPVAMPMVGAPVPTHDAVDNDVISIYSDSYSDISVDNYNPPWGQSTVVTFEPIDGNNTMKYANLNYQGIDFASNPQDVSNHDFIHLDFWTSTSTSLDFFLISLNPTIETSMPLTIVPDQWNSVDIPLAAFDQLVGPDLSAIAQMKIVGDGTVWWDNIYFHANAALPVELVSFNAIAQDRNVKLSWATSSEFNNSYFEVERSRNGKDFQRIDIVQGSSNPNVFNTYNSIDNAPNDGLNYYRLTQVDNDGKSNISQVVSVEIGGNKLDLVRKAVSGNEVELRYNIPYNGNYEVQAYSINGQLLYSANMLLRAGENDVNFATEHNGIIVVKINNNVDQLVQKILK